MLPLLAIILFVYLLGCLFISWIATPALDHNDVLQILARRRDQERLREELKNAEIRYYSRNG